MIEYVIKTALENKKTIKIIYASKNGISTRIIKPIKLDKGCLKAYCFTKEAVRVFKIENILSAYLLR